MDFFVLNQEYKKIAVIDQFESILWVDRYDKPGEFEIYTLVTNDMLEYPVVNNYIQIPDSDKTMIIEDVKIESNIETGNNIRITGRSLESILDRRYILGTIDVTGSLQDSIKSIINANIISPEDTDRAISNFVFQESEDSEITSLTYENQFSGISVLEAIEEMCQSKDIGFKILLNDANQFVMSLYKGTDRSYNQDTLPYVVFKPSFDNVISSNYSETNSDAKNFCYVHGQYVENSETVDVTRTSGSGTGLLRKEHYTDSSITKEDDMTVQEFYDKLDQDAASILTDYKVKKEFTGEYETSRMFKYNEDFFLGDVCQVANEYGMESTSRVTEYMWSISESGIEHYPTFTAIDQ